MFLWYIISIIFGHLLIDGMTSYGMRYFLPFSNTTYSRDNMFVIDFGMWIITIIGTIRFLLSKYKRTVAKRILMFVWWYITLSFWIQSYVTTVFVDSYSNKITQSNITKTITMATPLQPFLRRHIIKTNSALYEWKYSIFDSGRNVDWKRTTLYSWNLPFLQITWSLSSNRLGKLIATTRWMYAFTPSSSGYRLDNYIFDNYGSWDRMFGYEIIWSGSNYKIIWWGNRGSIDSKIWNDFWSRVRGSTKVILFWGSRIRT